MLNLKAMLEAATPGSLVLADEMGTGTAPEEGAALAVALLDEFRAKSRIVLATTHHDRLKTWASTTPGVVNAAVEFDDVNLRPTYRLMVGVPGGSSGIAIARRLGIADSIIERARALMAPEALEAADLIAYLHRSRDELDRMQQQMTRGAACAGRRTFEIARRVGGAAAKADSRAGRKIRGDAEALRRECGAGSGGGKGKRTARDAGEIGAAQIAGGAGRGARRAERRGGTDHFGVAAGLGRACSREENVAAAQLVPGARVRVRGFSKAVVLRRIDGSSAEIEAGPLRMKVGLDEITGVEGAGEVSPAKSSRGSITVRAQPTDENVGGEINLIGCTVEEATGRVDKFLDEAALANRSRVRIIHGHGTGALRKGLAQFLSQASAGRQSIF